MTLYTGAPDATSTQKGKLRLAGDLRGTADAPQVYTEVAFGASMTGDQTLAASTYTKVQLSNEEFDIGGNYDNSTYRFTAPVDGIYLFTGRVGNIGSAIRMFCALLKNGSEVMRGQDTDAATNNRAGIVSGLLELNATDYVELYGWRETAGDLDGGGTNLCYFSGILVGRK